MPLTVCKTSGVGGWFLSFKALLATSSTRSTNDWWFTNFGDSQLKSDGPEVVAMGLSSSFW